MTPNEILTKALNKMPMFFSGIEFSRECRKLGLEQKYFHSNWNTHFLHKNCLQQTRKTWLKNSSNQAIEKKKSVVVDLFEQEVKAEIQAMPQASIQAMTETEMIEALKATGKYKIYLITQTEI